METAGSPNRANKLGIPTENKEILKAQALKSNNLVVAFTNY